MIARLEQLGPFQFFFTLSMADKRWEENYVSIFAQRGCKISFIPLEVKSKTSFEPDKILINDIPLEDFMGNENKTDLFKNNVLTLTRIFDKRVHSFIKNIVCGPNSPFCVQYYTYRVEFQVRGAPHVHGALWLDLDRLEKHSPGIKPVMQRLQSGQVLSFEEKNIAATFVDKFVLVSSDTQLQDIVKDVQTHRHSKTCRKGGKRVCRFEYPRFPSERTIIAQPLQREDFVTEQEHSEMRKKYCGILEKVKLQLCSLEDSGTSTLEDILKKANISKEDYYTALSISPKGTRVIMKRSMSDIYTNNYNCEWLRAWNGNMDLQVCFDHFAITTYITDYYTKDESGTTKILKKAAEQKFSSLKDKMICLAQVFLSHRQMGLSEAFYRILPSLHLSESNIKCKFVHTGFPENRSKFLRKVHLSDNNTQE